MRFRATFVYSVPLFFMLLVRCCWLVCVEVPSDTEALHGTNMKLTCISCVKREEVNTDTMVEWTYITNDGKEVAIYEYNGEPRELKGPYQGRILWNGSKDLQDVSITIVNVTLNDSGLYRCTVKRYFNYEIHRPSVTDVKEVQLTVHEDALEDFTAYISEIMMYLLLVFLTLWLVIEMIYCYRKILKSEEAAQENSTDYLAIPSGNKENHSTVPVEE
ncbi:sodium channel subunit beta-3 [Chiloscyllium plagiosum]|uniref:sodium channel subunit beta-3 n=1 Tax=Chiloscyllium plagiosum TaxID=36176 RepID=UPI001CB80A03|nr:sodium channel subunit beta-3 [Chiloscyllium plagiosum]XP_043532722.1 sodium channel subunit beta-3 [Chiloscyllium plagiosum]XP_043532723.1 sodium channel subunit beta-3 [Chiloscyllium plagiosum]